MRTVDVIVIGGGHNGLSLAAYLAHAGVDVLVLERRAEFGGGLSTEEVTVPGFLHNLHSNFHGAMPFFPPFGDFQLEKRGAIYVHPPANTGMPMKDGRALVLYTDELRCYEELARFSKATHDRARAGMRGMYKRRLVLRGCGKGAASSRQVPSFHRGPDRAKRQTARREARWTRHDLLYFSMPGARFPA